MLKAIEDNLMGSIAVSLKKEVLKTKVVVKHKYTESEGDNSESDEEESDVEHNPFNFMMPSF